MFLKDRHNGHMIEIQALQDLFNLYQQSVVGRDQVGEEVQDAENYQKADLLFLSGEELPRCWVDPNYRHFSENKSLRRALHS